MTSFIKKFSEINKQDVGEVGGKNASLGEVYQQLSKHKINGHQKHTENRKESKEESKKLPIKL